MSKDFPKFGVHLIYFGLRLFYFKRVAVQWPFDGLVNTLNRKVHIMSVSNVTNKESLESHYAPHTMNLNASQIAKIKKALFTLPILLSVALIAAISVALVFQNDNQIKISADNYHPLVIAQPVVVKKQLLQAGQKAVKNQPLLSLEIMGDPAKLQSIDFHSPDSGYFFHSRSHNGIIKPNEPLGYILKHSSANEFSFLVPNKPDNMGSIGDQVKINVDGHDIFGKVSMVIGSFSQQKWQKIFIKFNSEQYLSLLSPDAAMTLELVKEPLNN